MAPVVGPAGVANLSDPISGGTGPSPYRTGTDGPGCVGHAPGMQRTNGSEMSGGQPGLIGPAWNAATSSPLPAPMVASAQLRAGSAPTGIAPRTDRSEPDGHRPTNDPEARPDRSTPRPLRPAENHSQADSSNQARRPPSGDSVGQDHRPSVPPPAIARKQMWRGPRLKMSRRPVDNLRAGGNFRGRPPRKGRAPDPPGSGALQLQD